MTSRPPEALARATFETRVRAPQLGPEMGTLSVPLTSDLSWIETF